MIGGLACVSAPQCSHRTEDFLDLSLSIPADRVSIHFKQIHVHTYNYIMICFLLQSSKSRTPAATTMTDSDGRVIASHCDTRRASVSTDDGAGRDAPFPPKPMSKHQKKKLRKEERRVRVWKRKAHRVTILK